MYKLYDIVNYKTDTRGYWLYNNRVYRDNIKILHIKDIKDYKHILFNDKKQEAIFYIVNNKAYIEYKQGNRSILKHCIRYKEKHITKGYLKALLYQHKGLTIYKHKGYYTIEIWKA
jgi:hypothetical protein